MKTFKISFRVLFTAFLLCTVAFTSIPLQAENAPILTLETLDNCPSASFSVTNNGAEAGVPVNFVNQSSGAVAYVWDFGDGNTSSEVSPSHSYSASGTYTVKLLAIGEGCTSEFIGTEDIMIQ